MSLCAKSSSLVPSTLSLLRTIQHSNVLIPVRSLISLPIEWKRPARLPFDHPIKTGDGTTSLTVDMAKAPVMVENSKEYENADELVKKLFTFNFLGRKYAMKRASDEMVDSVKNHKYDNHSTEVQIARKTAIIRNLLEHRTYYDSTDKQTKTYLTKVIQKRRRRIRCLRKYDYKRYEWLLEKLDLIYTPYPEDKEFVERKKSIRKLADIFCENYRQRKLDEYKEQLESQRADFLREKLETLKWIRQEELDCGVEPTVNDEAIQAAVDQLENHLQKLSLKPVATHGSRNILADN